MLLQHVAAEPGEEKRQRCRSDSKCPAPLRGAGAVPAQRPAHALRYRLMQNRIEQQPQRVVLRAIGSGARRFARVQRKMSRDRKGVLGIEHPVDVSVDVFVAQEVHSRVIGPAIVERVRKHPFGALVPDGGTSPDPKVFPGHEARRMSAALHR